MFEGSFSTDDSFKNVIIAGMGGSAYIRYRLDFVPIFFKE